MAIPAASPGQYKTTQPFVVSPSGSTGLETIPQYETVTVNNVGRGSTRFQRNGAPVTFTNFTVYESNIGPSLTAIPRRRKTRRNMRKSKSSRRNRKH